MTKKSKKKIGTKWKWEHNEWKIVSAANSFYRRKQNFVDYYKSVLVSYNYSNKLTQI